MNVIYDARYIHMSGLGTVVKSYINGILDAKTSTPTTFIFSNNQTSLPVINKLKKAGHHCIFISAKPFQLLEHIQLYQQLSRFQNAIYHVPHFNVPYIIPPKIKVICTIQDLAPDIFPKENRSWVHKLYYSTVLRRALKSDVILAGSEYTKHCLQDIHQCSTAQVLYNGFIPPKNSPSTITRDQHHLLYVGINKPRKNLQLLIAAMTLLPEKYQLTLVGNMSIGSYDIDQDCKKNHLEKRVSIKGYVSDDELDHLYKSASALVFPSLLEGFGYPILEAGAVKCPVICANSSSLPEVGGEGCLYFDPTDAQSCANAIIKLHNSQDLQNNLTTTLLERVSFFTTAKHIEACKNIYQSLLT